MSQAPIQHVGADFHVAVAVGAETPRRLHQVVVAHSQDAELVPPPRVLGKIEVEPRLEPVSIAPPGVPGLVLRISERLRGGSETPSAEARIGLNILDILL